MSTHGLLVACGEESIRPALDAFETAHFGGGRVDRVLLPGGCWWLAQAAALSTSRLRRLVAGRTPALDAVAALLADPALMSVALVAHQDCNWYSQHFPGESPGQLVKRAGADLLASRAELVRVARRPLPIAGAVLLKPGGAWETRNLF